MIKIKTNYRFISKYNRCFTIAIVLLFLFEVFLAIILFSCPIDVKISASMLCCVLLICLILLKKTIMSAVFYRAGVVRIQEALNRIQIYNLNQKVRHSFNLKCATIHITKEIILYNSSYDELDFEFRSDFSEERHWLCADECTSEHITITINDVAVPIDEMTSNSIKYLIEYFTENQKAFSLALSNIENVIDYRIDRFEIRQ